MSIRLQINKSNVIIIYNSKEKNMKSIERFLNYIKFDTQSNPYSNTSPSTKEQIRFAQYLVQELKQIGIHNAFLDQYGYVY